jgi:hypothetical protein
MFPPSSENDCQLVDPGEAIMKQEAIEKVSRKVSKQFPELNSTRPSIRSQSNKGHSKQRFTLTYKGKATLPNGRMMSRIVRVVADEHGKVLKMSTSK